MPWYYSLSTRCGYQRASHVLKGRSLLTVMPGSLSWLQLSFKPSARLLKLSNKIHHHQQSGSFAKPSSTDPAGQGSQVRAEDTSVLPMSAPCGCWGSCLYRGQHAVAWLQVDYFLSPGGGAPALPLSKLLRRRRKKKRLEPPPKPQRGVEKPASRASQAALAMSQRIKQAEKQQDEQDGDEEDDDGEESEAGPATDSQSSSSRCTSSTSAVKDARLPEPQLLFPPPMKQGGVKFGVSYCSCHQCRGRASTLSCTTDCRLTCHGCVPSARSCCAAAAARAMVWTSPSPSR